MTRDPEMFPDGDSFNPGRYLDPAYPTYKEPLTQYPSIAGMSQFGFGRRTCQGVPIVEQDLYLSMGGIAWALDLRKRRDPATGKEVPVDTMDYTPLLIAKPRKFQFEASPRSDQKLAQLRAMYEQGKDTDDDAEAGRMGGSETARETEEPHKMQEYLEQVYGELLRNGTPAAEKMASRLGVDMAGVARMASGVNSQGTTVVDSSDSDEALAATRRKGKTEPVVQVHAVSQAVA